VHINAHFLFSLSIVCLTFIRNSGYNEHIFFCFRWVSYKRTLMYNNLKGPCKLDLCLPNSFASGKWFNLVHSHSYVVLYTTDLTTWIRGIRKNGETLKHQCHLSNSTECMLNALIKASLSCSRCRGVLSR